MSKKKINTILIVAVASIWSVILYKFIAPYFSNTNVEFIAEVPINNSVLKIQKKDTINLFFPERDPFLGKTSVKVQPKINTSKKAIKRQSILKPILWPKIQYLGFVKSNNSSSRLALVRIDGKLHRVKNNAKVVGLKVKKINNDVLIMKNGKEERSFKKM